jgi:hypothetical protein
MIEYAPAIVGVMCVILALFVNRATDSIFKQVKKEVRLTLEERRILVMQIKAMKGASDEKADRQTHREADQEGSGGRHQGLLQ